MAYLIQVASSIHTHTYSISHTSSIFHTSSISHTYSISDTSTISHTYSISPQTRRVSLAVPQHKRDRQTTPLVHTGAVPGAPDALQATHSRVLGVTKDEGVAEHVAVPLSVVHVPDFGVTGKPATNQATRRGERGTSAGTDRSEQRQRGRGTAAERCSDRAKSNIWPPTDQRPSRTDASVIT